MKATRSNPASGSERNPFRPAPVDPRSPDAALLTAVLLAGIVAVSILAGRFLLGWVS